MKKIFVIALITALFTPFINAAAYSGGLLDNVPTDQGKTTLTDNINGNGVKNGHNESFTFSTPKDITRFIVTVDYPNANYKTTIQFFNEVGTLLNSQIIGSGGVGNYLDYERTVNLKAVKKINFVIGNGNDFYGGRMHEFNVYNDEIEKIAISGLTATSTHDSINLSWKNPVSEEFTGVTIKQNGVVVAERDKTVTSYKAINLEPFTNYSYEIITNYGVEKASPTLLTVKTKEAPTAAGEIIDLSATATHDKVNLSWSLPVSDKLQHVNIYRDTITETSFLDTLLGTTRAYAAATKIFETNGTYFNDLTVDEQTTYEYTLTTTSTEGVESEGVTEQVTTLEKPAPEIVGGGYEKDPATGDFIYYWTYPTEGQVKILVGGSEYKVVAATAKQILIPAADMKYTAFGDPNVTLIPIDSDGEEGAPVKPPLDGIGSPDSIGNVDVPFSATDLLKSGMGLFIVIAPFVLLALSFLLVPKLRFLLVQAFTKKEHREERKRRFESETRERKERQQRERTERTEREKRERTERKEKLYFTEKTIGSKGSRESVIVKAERVPTERRERAARQEREVRAEKERVTRERTPRTERGFR